MVRNPMADDPSRRYGVTYDGPGMARWLFERPEIRDLDDSRRRTVRHWAAGVNPTEQSVDALLCEIGLHLRDIPAWAAYGWPEGSTRGLDLEWDATGETFLRRAA